MMRAAVVPRKARVLLGASAMALLTVNGCSYIEDLGVSRDANGRVLIHLRGCDSEDAPLQGA